MDIYDEEKIKDLVEKFKLPAIEKIKSDTQLFCNLNLRPIIDYSYREISSLKRSEFIMDRCFMGEESFKEFLEFYLLGIIWIKRDIENNEPMSLEKYFQSVEQKRYEYPF